MSQEMTKLKTAYMMLPKMDQVPLRDKIIKILEVTIPTWYRWLDNPDQISKEYRKIIAHQFDKPYKTIFDE